MSQIGDIISRFEKKGFYLKGIKSVKVFAIDLVLIAKIFMSNLISSWYLVGLLLTKVTKVSLVYKIYLRNEDHRNHLSFQ